MVPGSTPNRRRSFWPKLALTLAAAAVAVCGIGALILSASLKSYLHSDSFRKFLGQKAGASIQADAEFQPLRWTGSSVYSDQFSARGQARSAFQQMRADQVRADLNLRAILRRVWRVDEITIQRIQVDLGQNPAANIEPEPVEKREPRQTGSRYKPDWLPNKFELGSAKITEFDVSWPGPDAHRGGVTGASVTLVPEGQTLNVTGGGGKLRQPHWPTATIDTFKLRYQDERLYITDASFKMTDKGTASLSGEVMLTGQRPVNLLTKFSGIDVKPFLPEDWRYKLSGDLSGDATIGGAIDQAKSLAVDGTISLADGTLKALPLLDNIAVFTRTAQFRELRLKRASARYRWQHEVLEVSALNVESEGLLAIRGDFIVKRGSIDGTFDVGVTRSSLRWLPGAQGKVFTVEHDGYIWAPMKLSGPVDHPSEDLSQRLIAAAADKVIEGVEEMTKDPVKSVIDLFGPLIPGR